VDNRKRKRAGVGVAAAAALVEATSTIEADGRTDDVRKLGADEYVRQAARGVSRGLDGVDAVVQWLMK